jgi:hypothetical protein
MMGADAIHHAGEFRPSEHLPLPKEIQFDPPMPRMPSICPGEFILQHVHPEQRSDKPFFRPLASFNDNTELSEWTIQGCIEFDANERVLFIFAHDHSLEGLIDVYPASANDWYTKAWSKLGQWRFLADFASAFKDMPSGGSS